MCIYVWEKNISRDSQTVRIGGQIIIQSHNRACPFLLAAPPSFSSSHHENFHLARLIYRNLNVLVSPDVSTGLPRGSHYPLSPLCRTNRHIRGPYSSSLSTFPLRMSCLTSVEFLGGRAYKIDPSKIDYSGDSKLSRRQLDLFH